MSLYLRGTIWWCRLERGGQVIQRSTRTKDHNKASEVQNVWAEEMAKKYYRKQPASRPVPPRTPQHIHKHGLTADAVQEMVDQAGSTMPNL